MPFRPAVRVGATLNYIKNMRFYTYCRRKSYSQISTDVALIVTNSAHLYRVLRDDHQDAFRTLKIFLIILSITLEVAIGIMLFLKERYDIDNENHHRMMTFLNDFLIFMIFGSVCIHVFVSVFVEDQHLAAYAMARTYKNCTPYSGGGGS